MDKTNYSERDERKCKECGTLYSIEETYEHSQIYFDGPENYSSGCSEYCLACWLGVGPNDVEKMDREFEKMEKDPNPITKD